MRARHFLIGLLSGIVLTVVAATLVAVSLMREPVASPMQPEPTKDGDIVVSVGERYLSTVATEMSRKRDESIQSIVVDVWPDGRLDLAVAARVRVLGLETTLQIKVISVLQVVDQTLLFSAQRIQLVGINIPLDALPESLRSAITEVEVETNRQIQDLLRENGLVPLGVSSDAARLTVALQAQ
ncbi:MAG: hypothetical protein FJ026_15620 [Chloroflexi bacterium]|nr:hypothetical protein [Chloroflexota bacterium]